MKKLYDGFVLIMIALVTTGVRDVVEFENSIGIAQVAGAIGDEISVDTVGVYEFDGKDSEAFAVGDVVYWDDANSEITLVSTAMTLAGVCWSVKTAIAGKVEVKIG